jgi:DNA modification methylase
MSIFKVPIHKHERVNTLHSDSGVHTIRPGKNTLSNSIIWGDSCAAVNALSPETIDCIVTSPPNLKQRHYGELGQIGQEEDPKQYIDNLREIFRECRRALKNDGVLWLNLGDKFSNGKLMGMPWRVALALVEDGWMLRSDVIWHKPNAMPSSVATRPTTDHEYIFLFSKSEKYRYFADAVREPHVTFTANSKMRGGRGHFGKNGGTPEKGKNAGNANLHKARWDQAFHPLGRNKRTVWSIPLSKFPDAHFAVFPEKLVETCIAASTNHDDTVLDPFCGSGTTLLVAKRMGRRFIGVDCNHKYCLMAQGRLEQEPTDLFDPQVYRSSAEA